jgi:serine phosphatase RsbU (regulator of sigma subunit)
MPKIQDYAHLGVMENILYKEKTIKLKPGDSILLFSDGTVEVENARKEWLGKKGFIRILKSLDYPNL